MLRRIAVLGSCCIAFAACARNDPAPPVTEIDTGLAVDTGTRDGAVADVGPDSGAVDGATDAGGDGTVDAPISVKCPKTFVGDKATVIEYAHGPGELLAGLTWDELTMVWTTSEASKIVVHYADRGSRDEPFATAKTLPDTSGPYAEDSVALAADGRTMIVVSSDHTTLTQLSRSARGVAFEATPSSAFGRITGPGSEGGGTKQLGDLVLSKDGKWLFYTDLGRAAGTTLMVSVLLSDGTWDFPNPVDGTALEMAGTARRRPTGISADSLTLFFYDEVFGASYLAFRTPGSLLFPETVPFSPTGRRARPNEACDRVYLSMTPPIAAPDGGSTDAAPEVGDARPPSALAIHHAP
ncbi:MAG: hypothetical protein JNL79_14400 [Myxococcales bacterium]|nr:hypothetical protein [Myxococcales bacterium]